MKEIKAFLHRKRVADVVHALTAAGFRNISLIDVKGMLKAIDQLEQEYSIEIGEMVITEVKLELVCDSDQVDQAVVLIRNNGSTGRANGG
ncbi:P-II family nitrogen regulator [Methyloceanibacter sp.]|uniref:P-II family nitrogen regulator n=1 Tax=Methyloceanibacter sp. TaxID=1965321 RepID=UPI002D1DD203|nr:P-II family nitrogen regulator [Methyloceanibacter sp.]HML92992.1 P-II family nitrogen regulator [Methyloceanibacter sp.]